MWSVFLIGFALTKAIFSLYVYIAVVILYWTVTDFLTSVTPAWFSSLPTHRLPCLRVIWPLCILLSTGDVSSTLLSSQQWI